MKRKPQYTLHVSFIGRRGVSQKRTLINGTEANALEVLNGHVRNAAAWKLIHLLMTGPAGVVAEWDGAEEDIAA